MSDHQWTVKLTGKVDSAAARVTADGWQVGPNGDLAFFNGQTRHGVFDPFFVRAFAAGTWTDVSLYA